MWKVLEKIELDIVGGWSTGFMDVSIEALWSQSDSSSLQNVFCYGPAWRQGFQL